MNANEDIHRCPDCNRSDCGWGLFYPCSNYPDKYARGIHEDPLHDGEPMNANELRHSITCGLVTAIGEVAGWKLEPDPRRIPGTTFAIWRNPDRGSIEVYVGEKHVIVSDSNAPFGTTKMLPIEMLGLHTIADRIGGIIRYGIIGS